MGTRKTSKDFIDESISVHGERYDYSRVRYINSKSKVCIICPDHGEFWQLPNVHTKQKSGCPRCGKIAMAKHHTLDFDVVYETISKIYPTDQYTPIVDTYQNDSTIMDWICKDHGIFRCSPNMLKAGSACKDCGYERLSNINRDTLQQFIEKAIKQHSDRYDYSMVKYVNNNTKVCIQCRKHGEFFQRPKDHITNKAGCPKCGIENRARLRTLSTSQVIDSFHKVHKNHYDYSLVEYHGDKINISIICPDHGIFHQTPHGHKNGLGCPRCRSWVSKMSQEWLDMMNITNDTNHREVKNLINNQRYVVDGYDPDTKTVYEFHGDYWHGNPDIYEPDEINPTNKISYGKLYEQTQMKKQALLVAGFSYIEMWESDWNKIS